MRLFFPTPDLKKVLARGNKADRDILIKDGKNLILYNSSNLIFGKQYIDESNNLIAGEKCNGVKLYAGDWPRFWVASSLITSYQDLNLYNRIINNILYLELDVHSTGYAYDDQSLGWNSDIDLPVCKSATFGERSLGFVPVLSVYRDGTPFSIPGGATPVPIQFNATEYDELSGWDSNLYEYTIQKSGKYWLNFGMTAENIASQNNQMALNLYVNDTPIGGGTVTLNNNEIKSFCKSRFIEFNQGDIIYLGAIVAYDDVDLRDKPYNTYFQMAYLGL
ncbi:MAG: hypothetical protein ACTSQ8_24745 [Candidatus Helarchaeota archaeon]